MLQQDYKVRAREAVHRGQKPSYPLSAFCLFSSIRRKTLIADQPSLTQKQLFKAISKEWKRLPGKEAYQAIAAEDYKEYKRLVKIWKAKTLGRPLLEEAQLEPQFASAKGTDVDLIRENSSDQHLAHDRAEAQTPSDALFEELENEPFPTLPAGSEGEATFAESFLARDQALLASDQFTEAKSIKDTAEGDSRGKRPLHSSSTSPVCPQRSPFFQAVSLFAKVDADPWDSSRSICTSSDELEFNMTNTGLDHRQNKLIAGEAMPEIEKLNFPSGQAATSPGSRPSLIIRIDFEAGVTWLGSGEK